jgi:hypothetical protein
MRLGSGLIPAAIVTGIALVALPFHLLSQESGLGKVVNAAAELPEAPQPQYVLAAVAPSGQQALIAQGQSAQQPVQSPTAQGSSSSQTPPQQPGAGKSQHELADEQIKEQEKQRIVGVVPAFNVSYRSDAVSMSPGQKMGLAFRSSIDPVTFASGFLAAGYHEALNQDPGFGWGIEGYGKRSGAAYLDAFDGTIIGNGILPIIFHQDPRYFRLGHGTVRHRLLYSLATNVICPHDNTRKWEPNYSNVLGNVVSGAISNLYYPSSNSGIGQTFGNGMIVTAEGAIASAFDEFWPDISRKFLHRDPTHGLDAKARAAETTQNGHEKQPLPPQK